MPFSPGENVGPYRIIEQLGQGGMATVFKAYHAGLDRFVAIKVMHPAFKQDPTFLARFQREARVVARLEHPHIVPIYDYAEHNGHPYLVMKYIEGETLKARLSRGPLTRDEGLRIVDAMGRALGYAHGRGILHRDMKPSNILLCPDGSIYLADFGLARIAQAGESTLSSEMLLGTPHYISPEQARGARDLDAGTDIYSFGVVLYEMVVGRVPFNADTPFSIIHDHIYTPLPLPQKINPRVPESVQRVLLKALAKERADRYATVEELSAAFLQAVSAPGAGPAKARADAAETLVGAPVPVASAPPPSNAIGLSESTPPPAAGRSVAPSAPAPKPKRRRTWLWIAGGLLLTLLCLILLIGAANNQGGEEGAAVPGAATPGLGVTDEVRDPGVLAARATLAAQPGDPDAQFAVAEAEARAGFELLAARDYRKAGELYIRSGSSLRATEAYLKAVLYSGGPDRADGAVIDATLKAAFTAGSEDPRGTLALVEEAGKALPDWAPLSPVRAHAHVAAGEFEPAGEILDAALARDPQDGLALAVQAELLRALGDRTGARRAAEAAQATGTIPVWLMTILNESLGKPPAGDLITIGGEGTGPGLFIDARTVGLDEAGRIYVGEYDGGRVQVFDAQGGFLTQWFADRDLPLRSLAVRRDGAVYTGQGGVIVLRDGQTGERLGQVEYTAGSLLKDVVILADGGLLTAWYRNRDDIVLFTPTGEAALTIPKAVSQQTGEAELGLRVASDGRGGVWALGEFSHAVFHYDAQGRFLNRFGSSGDEIGQFDSPQSIAVDGKGRIYVGEFSGVQVFGSDGRPLGRLEVEGPAYGLTIDAGGRLWVANGTHVRQYDVSLPG